MIDKVNVAFARLQFGGFVTGGLCDWWHETLVKAKADPRIDRVLKIKGECFPTQVTRNQIIEQAQQNKVDFVVMVDHDMIPDANWWDVAFTFAYQYRKSYKEPCIVAAPCCANDGKVVVCRCEYVEADGQTKLRMKHFTAEEVQQLTGVGEVALVPTGLSLWDVQAFDRLEKPYYFFKLNDDETKCEWTEDYVCAVNMLNAGVRQFVTWDNWAGHYKPVVLGKPSIKG